MQKLFITVLLMSVIAMANAQIVADHTIVDTYAEIPQEYIDSVKTMLVSIPGESHSQAYRVGMELLELIDNTYQAETYNNVAPPASTDQYVRIGRHIKAGEDFFFSETKILEMKDGINNQNQTGNPFHVIGFGWCWDMAWQNAPGGTIDPVHQVRWAGSTVGGPDGNMRWGLDSDDQALTGNSVCMDTYLEAVESYIQHCADSSYITQWIFTTGPVDLYGGTEAGFQRELKHDYIREYVAQDPSRILFDYADILSWSNDGEQNMPDWNDGGTLRPHANIHPENMMDYDASWNMVPHYEDGDHIGEVGAVRMAKAMWWMLARMAGWDGIIPMREVQVRSEGDSTWVMTGSQLQFFAAPTPLFATDTTVVWSVINGTGTASISSTGLLKGGLPGMVEVVALANDGSLVADTMDFLITDPLVPLTSIIISTAGGSTEIDAGTGLQCSAAVLPDTATNPAVLWSINILSGSAQISPDGFLTALTEGMVEVIATAEDGSLVADTVLISIEGIAIPVSDIQIASAGGASSVVETGTLQFAAAVLPANATNPGLAWSVINGTGSATISSEGLLTAVLRGTVDVVALATDGSGLGDTIRIVVLELEVPVTDIIISTAGSISELDEGSSLQCSATVVPDTATNSAVSWSMNNLSGSAQVSQDGLLTAVSAGMVEVIATAEDGSQVADTLQIDITAAILVTNIEIASSGGDTSVVSGETLQFTATVLPEDATNQELVWSVINGTGSASITSEGLLTGGLPGTVDVLALALDASGTGDTMALTITDPHIRVTGISITTAGGVTELEEGNTLQCLSTVSPVDATNHIVAWSVRNGTGSATINDNGLLAAISPGTIDVVATATDGSGVQNSLSLNINTATVMVSDIFIFSAGGASTVDEGSDLQFSATVLPANATNPLVAWSVSNGTGTAEICECATLTALTPGTVDVIATALDGSGISSTFAVTVLGTSGIFDGEDGGSILLYPNPSMGQFYLSAGEVSLNRIQVISTGGSVVLDVLPDPGDRLIEMDLSDQQPGIFFIHAFSEDRSYVHRIVISR